MRRTGTDLDFLPKLMAVGEVDSTDRESTSVAGSVLPLLGDSVIAMKVLRNDHAIIRAASTDLCNCSLVIITLRRMFPPLFRCFEWLAVSKVYRDVTVANALLRLAGARVRQSPLS